MTVGTVRCSVEVLAPPGALRQRDGEGWRSSENCRAPLASRAICRRSAGPPLAPPIGASTAGSPSPTSSRSSSHSLGRTGSGSGSRCPPTTSDCCSRGHRSWCSRSSRRRTCIRRSGWRRPRSSGASCSRSWPRSGSSCSTPSGCGRTCRAPGWARPGRSGCCSRSRRGASGTDVSATCVRRAPSPSPR